MRFKCSICLFFVVISAYTQSLQDRLFPLICDCFEEQASQKNFGLNLISKCFDISSGEKLKEFEEFLAQEIDTMEIMQKYGEGGAGDYGRNFAANFFSDIQEPLVNECEAYYEYLLTMNDIMMSNMTKGTNEKRADSLKVEIESGEVNPNITWEVGAFELGKENTVKAKEYFLMGVTKDSLHVPSNLFLGIVNDLQGDHQKAIKRFEKAEKGDLQHLVVIAQMFQAVSKRKLREKR
jgi:hypothetical protein